MERLDMCQISSKNWGWVVTLAWCLHSQKVIISLAVPLDVFFLNSKMILHKTDMNVTCRKISFLTTHWHWGVAEILSRVWMPSFSVKSCYLSEMWRLDPQTDRQFVSFGTLTGRRWLIGGAADAWCWASMFTKAFFNMINNEVFKNTP